MAGGLLVTVLWMTGYTATYRYLAPYLADVQRVPAPWVSPLLLALGIASLISTRAGGITDRRGHQFALVISEAAQTVALVLAALSLMVALHQRQS